jgi:hypothetical protein
VDFDGGALLHALIEPLRGAGIDSFVKLGGGLAPDQLFVALTPDNRGRVLHLQVMFLPDMEPPVLQFYVGLPYLLGDDVLDPLSRFLCAVNVTLPVGQFGLIEDQRLLYFRQNQPVVVSPLDFDVFGWSVTMVQFVVGHLGPILEAVAGGLGLAEGRRRLAEALEGVEADT